MHDTVLLRAYMAKNAYVHIEREREKTERFKKRCRRKITIYWCRESRRELVGGD